MRSVDCHFFNFSDGLCGLVLLVSAGGLYNLFKMKAPTRQGQRVNHISFKTMDEARQESILDYNQP